EVSEVDANNSVTTGGVKVPGLTVRRVDTTVELSSGQSFAIGGLLQSQTADTVSQIPGLGRLFSSKNFQDNKTEVVVIVTPYIVQPTGPGQLEQAIDTVARPSSDLEFAVQRNLGLDLLSGDTPRLVGAAGFVY
ncbi:type II and III secretion system protein family protein, partial [Burkholderia contaminans]